MISEQQRQALLDTSKRELKSTRKELEKAKESGRKDVRSRLSTTNEPATVPENEEKDIYNDYKPSLPKKNPENKEDDIYENYKPKLLSTSKYPKKQLLGE